MEERKERGRPLKGESKVNYQYKISFTEEESNLILDYKRKNKIKSMNVVLKELFLKGVK